VIVSDKTDAFEIVAEKDEKTPFEDSKHDESGDYLTVVSYFLVTEYYLIGINCLNVIFLFYTNYLIKHQTNQVIYLYYSPMYYSIIGMFIICNNSVTVTFLLK